MELHKGLNLFGDKTTQDIINDFCLFLGKLVDQDDTQEIDKKMKNNRIPVLQRSCMLFAIVFSPSTYQAKKWAVEKLSIILNICLNSSHDLISLNHKLWPLIIKKVENEDNHQHQQDLFRLSLKILNVINIGRENKWEEIMFFLKVCIMADNPIIIKMVYEELVLSHRAVPYFFGDTKYDQLVQYCQLFKAGLQEKSEPPKGALIWIHYFGLFLENFDITGYTKGFAQLVHPLMDTIEMMISEIEGRFLFNEFKLILRNQHEIFGFHVEEVFSRAMELLCNRKIKRVVMVQFYDWFSDFFKYFNIYIMDDCINLVDVFVDNIFKSQIDSYPNDPNQWFTDNIECADFFSKIDTSYPCYRFLKPFITLYQCNFYEPLTTKVIELLSSSNWKFVAMALDTLSIIWHYSKSKALFHKYMELLKIVSELTKHENPVIGFSAIRTITIFSIRCSKKKFFKFVYDIPTFIIKSWETENSTHVKLLCLHALAEITHKRTLYFKRSVIERISEFYKNLIDELQLIENSVLKKIMIKSICENIEFFHSLVKKLPYVLVPSVTDKILTILKKIYFLTDFDYSVHCLIEYLGQIIMLYSLKKPLLVSKVVKFFQEFNNESTQSSSEHQIPSCFYPFLDHFFENNQESCTSLLPKIRISIIRFLQTFKNNVQTSINDGKIISNPLVAPIGCSCCFKEESDGGVTYVCTFVANLYKTYNDRYIKNIELHLATIFQILLSVDLDRFHLSALKSVCLLLSNALMFQNNKAAVKIIREIMKNEMFKINTKTKSFYTHQLIFILSNIITLMFNTSPISEQDIFFLGEALSYLLDSDNELCTMMMNSGLIFDGMDRSNSQLAEYDYSTPKFCLLSYFRRILPFCRKIIIDSVIPMFEVLVNDLVPNRLSLFHHFSLNVADHIIRFIPLSEIITNGLSLWLIDLSLGLQSINGDKKINDKADALKIN